MENNRANRRTVTDRVCVSKENTKDDESNGRLLQKTVRDYRKIRFGGAKECQNELI